MEAAEEEAAGAPAAAEAEAGEAPSSRTVIRWRKALAEARAAMSGDDATEIPAPGASGSPRRVRLYVNARAPVAPAARGVLRQITRDLSDRSERGDPRELFEKYGGGVVPMAMAIPFTGAGAAMLVFLPRQAPHQLLPWVFGSIFTLAGLLLFSLGLSALRTAARGKRRAEKEPWHSDNAWDPRGARPDAPGKSLAGFLGGILFFLLIGAFNVLWTVRKDLSGWIVVTIVLVVFDALGLLLFASILAAIVQRVRAGSPRLLWRKFPVFTGERFEASFLSGRPLHVTGPVRATLRCVEQVNENANGREEARPYAIYAHSQTFGPPGSRLSSLDVSFEVPPSAPGTDLVKGEPTYWLLEVRAPLAGPDFSAQFLVPIYARPSGPSASTG